MKNELKQILGNNETFTIVYKGLFPLKLKPIDLLILSRVIEWYNNDKICYETNKSLSDDFGVSEDNISDAIKRLEKRGLITKETKQNTSGRAGKQRKIFLNMNGLKTALQKTFPTGKIPLEQQQKDTNTSSLTGNLPDDQKEKTGLKISSTGKIPNEPQQKNASLPSPTGNFRNDQQANFLKSNRQISLIKDNIKDNIKDKESSSPSPIIINQEDFIQQGLAPTMIVHEEDNEGNKIVESCGKTYKIIPPKQTPTAQEQIAALGF